MSLSLRTTRDGRPRKKIDRNHWLYIAVIVAVVAGIVVGLVAPQFATGLEPVGKGFVSLIKMMIAPVIFCTIVVGIGSIAKASTVGKIGGLALLVVTSPGWDSVKETFFSWSVFTESFPDVLRGFWLDVKIFVVVEVIVLFLGLVVALARVSRGPALFPLRLLGAVYVDLFRGIPTILLVYISLVLGELTPKRIGLQRALYRRSRTADHAHRADGLLGQRQQIGQHRIAHRPPQRHQLCLGGISGQPAGGEVLHQQQ